MTFPKKGLRVSEELIASMRSDSVGSLDMYELYFVSAECIVSML